MAHDLPKGRSLVLPPRQDIRSPLPNFRIQLRQVVRLSHQIRTFAGRPQMRQIDGDVLHPMIDLIVQPGHFERDQEAASAEYAEKENESDDHNRVVQKKVRMKEHEQRHADRTDHGHVEQVGHHGDERTSQQIRLGEPIGVLRKKRVFPDSGERFGKRDRDPRVDPLLQCLYRSAV